MSQCPIRSAYPSTVRAAVIFTLSCPETGEAPGAVVNVTSPASRFTEKPLPSARVFQLPSLCNSSASTAVSSSGANVRWYTLSVAVPKNCSVNFGWIRFRSSYSCPPAPGALLIETMGIYAPSEAGFTVSPSYSSSRVRPRCQLVPQQPAAAAPVRQALRRLRRSPGPRLVPRQRVQLAPRVQQRRRVLVRVIPFTAPSTRSTVRQPIRLRTLPGTSRIRFSQSGLRSSSTFAGLLVRSAPRKRSISNFDRLGADAPAAWSA